MENIKIEESKDDILRIILSDSADQFDNPSKIKALAIILQSKKTTEVLVDHHLLAFKNLFPDFLTLQDAAQRQIAASLVGKFIRRLHASLYYLFKTDKLVEMEEKKKIRSKYQDLLGWLVDTCIGSIYCNAFFGSFILTLSTLKLIIENIGYDNPFLDIESLLNKKQCYDSIIGCLSDSFEENKKLALELLFMLPKSNSFFSQDNLNNLEEIAYKLVRSVNPANCVTCQYVFKLIVKLESELANIHPDMLLLRHISTLLDIVEKSINNTESNFLYALPNDPIYPKITCIRALLSDKQVENMDRRDAWVTCINRLVSVLIDACVSVSKVVCNLNPETIGHLPMDLKPLDIEALTQKLNLSEQTSPETMRCISSQMLLISGWKTIKECSISMGYLCTKFWWPKGLPKLKPHKNVFSLDVDPLLENKDIERIVAFFDHYLRNLRHRGAFEQAYNGFVMVANRIWNDDSHLKLLIDTLDKILKDFTNQSSEETVVNSLKAHITRRSAGLPFIVQAILISEHRWESKQFRRVMDTIITVVRDNDSQDYQKVHCLNILKALICVHNLGEKVLPYVGVVFSIVMEAFKSSYFPIRNCANMLVKALIDRTFGCNRSRHKIHRKNQMSYEKFFTLCPNLHKEMLSELNNEPYNNVNCYATLHCIFIILSRLNNTLEPSSGYTYEMIIKPFIGPILKISFNCVDMKLRKVASKLVVHLETIRTDTSGQITTSFYVSLQEVSNFLKFPMSHLIKHQNQLQGVLFIIKNWIEKDAELNINKLEDHDYHDILMIVNFLLQNILVKCRVYTTNREECFSDSIGLAIFQVVEALLIYKNNINIERKLVALPKIQSSLCLQDCRNEPDRENIIYKYLVVATMLAKRLDQSMDLIDKFIYEIVGTEGKHSISTNLQASIVRLIRLCTSDNDYELKTLTQQLVLDGQASHHFLHDIYVASDEGTQDDIGLSLTDLYQKTWNSTFKLCTYQDFKQTIDFCTNIDNFDEFKETFEKGNVFRSRKSNSMRAVELLALIVRVGLQSTSCAIKTIASLEALTSSLPDCDTKCIAIYTIARLMRTCIEKENLIDYETTLRFVKILRTCCSEEHSDLLRLACAFSLRLIAKDCIIMKSIHEQDRKIIVDIMETLIISSQDENIEIRKISFQITESLSRQCSKGDINSSKKLRSNLSVVFITEVLLDPSNDTDVKTCINLMFHIIFGSNLDENTDDSNACRDDDDVRESLFDKCLLNCFSDSVASIQGAVRGFYLFISRALNRAVNKLDIHCIDIPDEIYQDSIKQASNPTSSVSNDTDTTGDYSWRIKLKEVDRYKEVECQSRVEKSLVMDKFYTNFIDSLSCYNFGYENMLMDNEYPFKEILLLKRVAFISIINLSTNYKFPLEPIIQKLHAIRCKCSTAVINQCLELLLT